MGLFKKIAAAITGFSRGNVRILVVGLDNSGKSTLIEHIKPSKVKLADEAATSASVFEATPTVGFKVEEFAKKNLNFTVFDMSGQSRYRTLWEHYFCDVHAIIFVVDSTDRVRMCVARDELEGVIKHNEVQSSGLPLLVYANKGDLPGAMSAQECADELGLGVLDSDRNPWHIVRSNALVGSGIEEGVNWLVQTLRPRATRRESSMSDERRRSSERSSSSMGSLK